MASSYKQRVLAKGKASVGDATAGIFTYKGFDSTRSDIGYKLYDVDLVKKDIMNHFYIRKGEKLENPDFGTIIWDMIFEQFTPEVKEKIAENVQDIINYDPRIQVESVSVDSTEQGIRIEAIITYLPFNIKERMKFDFDRESGTVY
jgi:phage baseplate assembly protein W